MKPHTTPKVAIVYDWATTHVGGAESVLAALNQLFPDAPLFTSIAQPELAPWIKNWRIITSFLQKIPILNRHHRWCLLGLPLAFESFDLREFEIVISVTSAFAKGVITSPNQLHICYLFSPPRFLYSHELSYLETVTGQKFLPIVTTLTAPIRKYLKQWDHVASSRPDQYITLSQLVALRLKQFYDRKADAILPPPLVPLSQTANPKFAEIMSQLPKSFYVITSRLVAYKKIDVAIRACASKRKPLVIVGEGPEEKKLRAIAKTVDSNQEFIFFLPHISEGQLDLLFQHTQALLMPGVEDFGLAAMRSLANGVPVVIHEKSGVAEWLRNTEHGVWLSEVTVPAIISALEKLEQLSFDTMALRKAAKVCDAVTFQSHLKEQINLWWHAHQERVT